MPLPVRSATSPARDILGLATSDVRKPLEQVAEGAATGGAADHAPSEQGHRQLAQLRHPQQTPGGDEQTAGGQWSGAREIRVGGVGVGVFLSILSFILIPL